MEETQTTIGFSYFSSPKYFLNSHLKEWMPAISDIGACAIIFQSGFVRAIPEDAFLIAEEFGLNPIVQFTSELPKAKEFNKAAILFDTYKNRGVEAVILGDRPNIKGAWPSAGWHYENLVEHFLERFIPLANYAVRIGMRPVFPPLQPGGDFWDTSFVELAINSLKNQKLDAILKNLILSSFGYTFGKPLTWGRGGPERWTGSKPYQTPEGQEDQLGFHNFEWMQKIAERILGNEVPVMILDAGLNGTSQDKENSKETKKAINALLGSLTKHQVTENQTEVGIKLPDSVLGCNFSLDKLKKLSGNNFYLTQFFEIFSRSKLSKETPGKIDLEQKFLSHYLLLPSHAGSVSDVVLSKVRPIIKKFRPTVGFSLVEAAYAKQVSIFPDPILFTEEKINQLRSAGCIVEILPESGIEIATRLQET